MPRSPQTAEEWFLEKADAHQTRLCMFLRSLGVRPDAVDDLAQETWLVAWAKQASFDRSSNFGGWISEIARRLVANERRKSERQRRILSEDVTNLLLASQPADRHPAAALEHEERAASLRECLAKLPSSSRNLIEMKYWEGLSFSALASRLGGNTNGLRQQLLKLRRKLLRCLERRLGDRHGGE